MKKYLVPSYCMQGIATIPVFDIDDFDIFMEMARDAIIKTIHRSFGTVYLEALVVVRNVPLILKYVGLPRKICNMYGVDFNDKDAREDAVRRFIEYCHSLGFVDGSLDEGCVLEFVSEEE